MFEADMGWSLLGKEIGIASGWVVWRMVQPHGGRQAWEHACEPDLGVVVVGSDALAGNCD